MPISCVWSMMITVSLSLSLSLSLPLQGYKESQCGHFLTIWFYQVKFRKATLDLPWFELVETEEDRENDEDEENSNEWENTQD